MRRRASKILVALALVLGTAAASQAALNVWQQSLPGVEVYSVATGPRLGEPSSSDLYVGVGASYVGGAGILKSADGGYTWSKVASYTSVMGLATDPSTPGRVYAATGSGLYRTNDGGASWSQLRTDTRSSISVSMLNPNTLYADNWKSTDAGATWTQMPTLPSFYTADAHLKISPVNDSLLYAITSSAGYWSIDAGASWTSKGWGAATYEPDPVDSQFLYQGGYFVGTSGAQNVRYFPGGSAPFLTTFPIKALAVDPQSPNLVYAASMYGALKSADFGATWSWYRMGTGPDNAPGGEMVFDNSTGKIYVPAWYAATTTNRGLWMVQTRGVQTCTDGDIDGFFLEGPICSTAADCNDAVAAINPAAAENCVDTVDNNCNGYTDCADPACSGTPSCPPPCTTPGKPSSLSAAAAKRSINLTWGASSPAPATTYRLYRSLSSSGPFTLRASVNPTTLTYKDTGLTTGTRYYYYVKAWSDCDADWVVDAGEEGLASITVSAVSK